MKVKVNEKYRELNALLKHRDVWVQLPPVIQSQTSPNLHHGLPPHLQGQDHQVPHVGPVRDDLHSRYLKAEVLVQFLQHLMGH